MKSDDRDYLAMREASATPAPWRDVDVEARVRTNWEDAEIAAQLRNRAVELLGESRQLATLRSDLEQAIAYLRASTHRDGVETLRARLDEVADMLENRLARPAPTPRLVRRCGKCGMDTTVAADTACRRCGHDNLFGLRVVW